VRIKAAEFTNPVQISESNEFLRTANQIRPESWRERERTGDVMERMTSGLISLRGSLVRDSRRG